MHILQNRHKQNKQNNSLYPLELMNSIHIVCTYLSPLWSTLFSDGDVILVELPVLTTGLDLEGDLVKLVTLFSVDLVRVGVVVAL